MSSLPINRIKEEILQSLCVSKRLLLRAPTGSGKSTCVPPMVMDDGGVDGLILVVQPRRIAARMLSRRVAHLRGGVVGDEVGYVVRFDKKMGSKTRLVYITDGILQRWLLDDPTLSHVGAVIFDEFHERRIASDVALARCLELQDGKRSDLQIIVMSATLEVAGLREYLSPCEVLEAEGRTFPVDIEYRGGGISGSGSRRQVIGGQESAKIWDTVTESLAKVVKESREHPEQGHILVFLPGVYEIRRTIEQIERSAWSRGWKVCPLYSGLSPSQQDEAIDPKPGGARRIIISTNVAETSLTIDGVTTVIDSGVARVSRYDATRGIDTLMIEKISQASADQRAGRAGRVAPGRCIRLWSEADHGRRPAFETPEIARVDLAETCLSLKSFGVTKICDFRWLDTPPETSLDMAENLLLSLGAVKRSGEISPLGKMMITFPLHPRYARLLLAGEAEGCVAEAAFIAAVVQGEGVFVRGARGNDARDEFVDEHDTSDFESEWRAYQVARDMRFDPRRCQANGLLARGAREVFQSFQMLERLVKSHGFTWRDVDFDLRRHAVSRAMLSAFSDRLSVRQGHATLACRVVGGKRGKLDTQSVVKKSDIFIATEMTEVEGREVLVYLNRCVDVSENDLRDVFPDEFVETDGAVYDETTRRVVKKREVRFRELIIRSKEGGDPPLDVAAQLLAERVFSGELSLKNWDAGVERWIARLLCLGKWMPEMELPGFDDDDRLMVLEEVCQGAKSYKEIKNRDVMGVLNGWLSEGQKQVMDAYAPLEVTLSNGRKAKVRYSLDGPPWIAMKMQFLYDVYELPEIAQGRVKLLVHLLAPNQRPWQVTDDLAGFWERGYPQMKKDLAGRYPRHEWR